MVYVYDVRTRSLEQIYDFPNDSISFLYPARDHEVVIFTSNPTIAYSIDFQTKKVNNFSCPGLTASYVYTAFENCGNSGYFISMHSFSPSAHMAIWNHNTRTCKVIPTYYAFRTIRYLPSLNKIAISWRWILSIYDFLNEVTVGSIQGETSLNMFEYNSKELVVHSNIAGYLIIYSLETYLKVRSLDQRINQVKFDKKSDSLIILKKEVFMSTDWVCNSFYSCNYQTMECKIR